MARPHVVVLGRPNGAGKSTVAPRLLRGTLNVRTFVNADEIARGIPERDVRRRWARSLVNFFDVYAPTADTWNVFDGSERPERPVASGVAGEPPVVRDGPRWNIIAAQADTLRQGDYP